MISCSATGLPVRLPTLAAPQLSTIHGAWIARDAACGGSSDASGHAGGTPCNPAAHKGASGGKPPLVDAHTGLTLPATPGVAIGHAVGNPWGPVTHTGGSEASGPAVRCHWGVKPAP